MAVLYRKYRPQIFADVLGQKFIVQTLKNQVQSGNFAHAYLFTGSRGVGKTTLARILAKAVNCENRQQATGNRDEGDACGQCGVCKQIEQGNFIDLIEVDAASNTGVDNIRDLIEHIKFSPSMGKYKVFIIDEVHMLSKGAFNALLKTLEEPPKHAVFILATTEINKVPLTIISRAQRFDFKKLNESELKEQIGKILKAEGLSLADDIIQLLARNSEGSVRDALSLLDKVLTLGQEATLEECELLLGVTDLAVSEKLLELITEAKAEALPQFYENLLEKGADLLALNRDFLEYLRKALILKITGKDDAVVLDGEAKNRVKNLILNLSALDLIYIIKLFLRSFKELASSPKAEIPLLVASLEAAFKIKGQIAQNPAQLLFKPPLKTEPEVKKNPEAAPVNNQESANEGAPADASLKSVVLEEIKPKWAEVISIIKQINSPLANIVRCSNLSEASGNTVKVLVKFKFHKQNLENIKNQELIRNALKKVFGQNLRLLAEVGREESGMKEEGSGGLENALKVFGGELLE